MSRRTRVVLTTGLLVLLTAALAPATEPKIELRTVKYDDLIKEVRGLKGKVVVVDVWADYCVPCKREFPNLVKLRKAYGKDVFVAISVTVDAAKDKPNAIAFLDKMKATDLINLHLDEDPEVWRTRFKIVGPPAVYVFDQDNRIALKMPVGDEGVDYAVIAKKVQELLKK